uniref:Uncharacterized protein n=1 Tax=viral metagenome TaxID=1070528 RepID=A0A6M3XSX5_9ZZZZ
MNKPEQIARELETVRKNSPDGILRAEDVVEYARDSSTVLHSQFEWDDNKAAQEYRIWQARHIISVTVTVLPRVNGSIRAYVSLTPDRHTEGGGYRQVARVLRNKSQRDQMLDDALADFKRFEEKYKVLKALIPLFETARKIKEASKRGSALVHSTEAK